MGKVRSKDRVKLPRQKRAQKTVHAILVAAAHALVDKGYDSLTTNQVAKAAGVSIGALYKYFPNKEALVSHLIDRQIASDQAFFESLVREVSALRPEERARHLIAGTVERHKSEKELRLALHKAVTRLGKFEDMIHARSEYAKALIPLLTPRAEKSGRCPVHMAHVLVHSCLSSLYAYTTKERAAADYGALQNELHYLVTKFLEIQ